jgi:hypothetical protein
VSEPWYWKAMKESYARRNYIVFYVPIKGHFRVGQIVSENEVGDFPQPFRLVTRTTRQDYDEKTRILSEFFSDVSFREIGDDGEFFRAVTE